MNTILAKGKSLFGKAALATVALGGFLAFFGAGTASARPVVPERERSSRSPLCYALPLEAGCLPPSRWSPAPSDADDAACSDDVCPRKA